MNRSTLSEKLESLDRCIKRLKSKTPSSIEALESDIDSQDIIAINLERAIQLCVDIASIILAETECQPPKTMGECFRLLQEAGILSEELADQLVKAVGFRNLSVHAYDKIDWGIVFSLLRDEIADLRAFGAAVTKFIENR